MEMKSTDVSATSGTVSSGFATGSRSSWRSVYMSITAIWLNGCNYPPWAKPVEVYLMAKGQDKYLIEAPLVIRILLMQLKNSGMLKFDFVCGIVWSLRLIVV